MYVFKQHPACLRVSEPKIPTQRPYFFFPLHKQHAYNQKAAFLPIFYVDTLLPELIVGTRPGHWPAGRAVLVPSGAPGFSFLQSHLKEKCPAFQQGIFWCTIGDSNPGPTD